jgi:ABC-type multidrug transport system fused ATPase/permease subunit
VHAGGGNLSAGEAQLLAMARVFLGDPGVVLLDEPSSRLDPATERRLELALERLLRGRTAVIIAHRLDTVDRVDAVAVLDDGAVIEHGPRAALAADPATRYARLLRAARGAAPGVDAALEELA